MRVLVCGSRSWTSEKHGTRVYMTLDAIDPDEIIHGGAQGADEWAMQWATDRQVRHIMYPADWNTHGRRAGILRNLAMLDSVPDQVVAFWDGRSKGTLHTITEAKRRGIPTTVVKLFKGQES